MAVYFSSRMVTRSMMGGIAAVALAATGAFAQPQGKGQGGGNGNGGNGPAMQERGPDKEPGGDRGNAGGNGGGNAGTGGPSNKGPDKPANGGKDREPGQRGNGNAVAGDGRAEARTGAGENGNRRAEVARRDNNGNAKRAQAKNLPSQRGNGGNGNAPARIRYGSDPAAVIFARNDLLIRDRGILNGCPPGLAKKRNGCTPPGLDRRSSYRFDDAGWWGLPGLSDGRYRYYGGNLVRLSDAGSILGYYPLLGGALSVGNAWPGWYDAEPLPRYTQEYFSLGPSYRYADNVIYRTDPQTDAITSIAALLTGSDFRVGQPLPSGYDIYNVPYAYRDRYRDGPDARYRYSDGYVYQVDPTTQLIVAAIELLA